MGTEPSSMDEKNHHVVDDAENGSSDAPIVDIDPAAEKKLLWKLDLTIYPILFIVYMMSFLDRINISNARIVGMTDDIDLSGNRFNIALFIYFVPYILLEVPSNMVIRRVRPSYYLSGLMFCWGIINMCMAWANSFGVLVVLRLLLGAFEAGVLPGIIYLTAMYYKRHEFQKRMSFFFCSTLIGGAFGGLLAYAIAGLDGQKGMAGWQWIFLIEGAITAFIAIIAAFLIVDWPEQNKWLNADELALLKARLRADVGDQCRMDTLNKYSAKLIFSDYKIWLGSLIYMGVGTTGYATVYFMPTILFEFGEWTGRETQIHTIPVYVVSAFGMLFSAWLSDRLKHRYFFILGSSLITTLGYAILFAYNDVDVDTKYAAIFLIPLGAYIGTPMALGWLQNNLSGHWKRSFGSGFQITLGNFAGIIASNVFLITEKPTYKTGYGVCFAMCWMGTLAATAMYFLMKRENAKRDAGERDERLTANKEELENMGDYHPSFRFTM